MSKVNQIVEQIVAQHINPIVGRIPEYPLIGKKAVKATLDCDETLAILTLRMMYHLQTDLEQVRKDTHEKNRQGFMSSDATVGSTLAVSIESGRELSLEEMERAVSIGRKYSRQLTRQLTSWAIRTHPEIAPFLKSKFNVE